MPYDQDDEAILATRENQCKMITSEIEIMLIQATSEEDARTRVGTLQNKYNVPLAIWVIEFKNDGSRRANVRIFINAGDKDDRFDGYNIVVHILKSS